jgi:hypothetical protein
VDPCPVCGTHALALEQPPHIPVVGAQPYTELYRMGDLPMPIGVRCRSCGTAWPTIEALRAGERGSAEVVEPVDDLAPFGADAAADVPVASRERSLWAAIVMVAAIAVGVMLLVLGFLELAFIVVGAAALVARALAKRRQR